MSSKTDIHEHKMFFEKERLKTFVRWPHTGSLSKEKMAKFGFYKIKPRQAQDLLRCAFCRRDFCDFKKDADPCEEHLKVSPACPFAKQRKFEGELLVAEWLECIFYAAEVELRQTHEKAKQILDDEIERLEKAIKRLKSDF